MASMTLPIPVGTHHELRPEGSSARGRLWCAGAVPGSGRGDSGMVRVGGVDGGVGAIDRVARVGRSGRPLGSLCVRGAETAWWAILMH